MTDETLTHTDLLRSSAFLVTDDDAPGLLAACTGAYVTVYAAVGTDSYTPVDAYATGHARGLADVDAATYYDDARRVLRRTVYGVDPVEAIAHATDSGRLDATAAVADGVAFDDAHPDLSGQWADGRTVDSLLTDIGADTYTVAELAPYLADELGDAYATAYYTYVDDMRTRDTGAAHIRCVCFRCDGYALTACINGRDAVTA